MNTVKQYLGKVSITTNGEHDINKSYDRLCLVYTLIDGDEDAVKTYISRKAVPAGINISNKEYWQPFSVDIGDVFTQEDKTKLDSIETGANKLFLGITHNDAADGYFANKLNNVVWNEYTSVQNGDAAFQAGIYPNIVRGCPNILLDGTRKWLGGIWTFIVISGYNKDEDKYHILQLAFRSDIENASDSYDYSLYARHIKYDTLYTWEGNPDPVFGEWKIADSGHLFQEAIEQHDTWCNQLFEDVGTLENEQVKVGLSDNGLTRALKRDSNKKGYIQIPDILISDGGQSRSLYNYDDLGFSDFTVEEHEHTLDIRVKESTSSSLGGVKIGYVQNSKNYPLQLDVNKKAYVNVPWTDTTYDVATSSVAGLMSPRDKDIIDNLSSISRDGIIVKSGSVQRQGILALRINNGSGLDLSFEDNNTTLTLGMFYADDGAAGVIKLGYIQNDKNYPVQLDSDHKAYVEVPNNPFEIISISNINSVTNAEKRSIYNHLAKYKTFDNLKLSIAGESSEVSLTYLTRITNYTIKYETTNISGATAPLIICLEVTYDVGGTLTTKTISINTYTDFNPGIPVSSAKIDLGLNI